MTYSYTGSGIVRFIRGLGLSSRIQNGFDKAVRIFHHPGPGIPQLYRPPTTATMGFPIPIRTTPAHGDILLPVKKPLEREDPANSYLVQAYGNNSKLTMRNPGKLFPEHQPPKAKLHPSPYKPPARRYLNPNLPINTPYNSDV